MITIRDLTKEFGYQTLFKNASLQINEGDRYALVGPNGSGKSTLFKILLGQESPDKGEVSVRRGARVGYLPQERAVFDDDRAGVPAKRVREEVVGGWQTENYGTVLGETLAGTRDPDDQIIAKAKAVLAGLGFKEAGFEKKMAQLSGGWAMRVAIARLLVEEPDLLLLDEPTNHLDLDSLLWLQDYLKNYSGAIFLITHDRAFLNALCGAIVSVLDRDLRIFRGSYEDFLEAREREKAQLEAAYRFQKKQIAEMEEFIERNRARLSTASRAQSMVKRLEKLERVELPREMKAIKIRFPQPQRAGVRVLTLKKASKSYADTKVYEGLDFHLERGWKMALVGHNGAGKSTLLKILGGVIDIDSGERVLGVNAKVGYYSQHRDDMLNPNQTVFKEASDNTQIGQTETYLRTVLGSFLFPGDTVFKKVSVLSGGEKSRLALVKLLLDPPNVLLMDEPTTHLDMPSVDALAGALKDYEGSLCFISHDIYFINQIATHIVHVDHGKITVYLGDYEYFQRRSQQIRDEALGINVEPEKLSPPPARGRGEVPVQRSQAARRERALEKSRSSSSSLAREEIARIKKEIEALAKQMEDPAVHADYPRLRALGEEIQALQEKASNLERDLNQRGKI